MNPYDDAGEPSMEFEAKTLEDAVRKASAHYGVDKDRLEVTVLENTRRIFNIMGGSKVKIKVRLKGQSQQSATPASGTGGRIEEAEPEDLRNLPEEDEPEELGPSQDLHSQAYRFPEDDLPRRSERRPYRDPQEERPHRPLPVEAEAGPWVPATPPGKAVEVLQTIARNIDPQAQIRWREAEETTELEIITDRGGLFIGKNGETLAALQFVINKILMQAAGGELQKKVLIDTQGYRERRRNSLIGLALKTKRKVVRAGRECFLDVTNSYERWIIHNYLLNDAEVGTRSEGEGNERRLVTYPKHPGEGGAQPDSSGEDSEEQQGKDEVC